MSTKSLNVETSVNLDFGHLKLERTLGYLAMKHKRQKRTGRSLGSSGDWFAGLVLLWFSFFLKVQFHLLHEVQR